MQFEVSFYQDNNGQPGQVVGTYTVTPSVFRTGILYHDEFELNEYAANLEPCVQLENGWVSVVGSSVGGNVGDCWFFWIDSQMGDGTGFYSQGDIWTPIPYDWSFCLLGAGGCSYTLGDVNGNNIFNGIDVTYGVLYFKGGAAPTEYLRLPDPRPDLRCRRCQRQLRLQRHRYHLHGALFQGRPAADSVSRLPAGGSACHGSSNASDSGADARRGPRYRRRQVVT